MSVPAPFFVRGWVPDMSEMMPLTVKVLVSTVMVAPNTPNMILFDRILAPAMPRIAPMFPTPVPITELILSAMVRAPAVPSICSAAPLAIAVAPAPPRAELFLAVTIPALIVVAPT